MLQRNPIKRKRSIVHSVSAEKKEKRDLKHRHVIRADGMIIDRLKSYFYLVQPNKQQHREVLLSSFHLNGRALGFKSIWKKQHYGEVLLYPGTESSIYQELLLATLSSPVEPQCKTAAEIKCRGIKMSYTDSNVRTYF